MQNMLLSEWASECDATNSISNELFEPAVCSLIYYMESGNGDVGLCVCVDMIISINRIQSKLTHRLEICAFVAVVEHFVV